MAATRRTPARHYHRDGLERELVDLGMALVRERGHPAVSIREVARGARVSHTAAHYHFATRETLLAAIATRGFDDMTAVLAKAIGAVPQARRMRALGVAYVTHAVREPALYRLMFGAELAERTRYPGLVAAADRLLAVLGSAQTPGEPARMTEAAAAAWSVVHGLSSLIVEGQLTGLAARHRTPGRMIASVLDNVSLGAD